MMQIRRRALLVAGAGICGVLAVLALVEDVGQSPWRAAKALLPTLEVAAEAYSFKSKGPDGVLGTSDDIAP